MEATASRRISCKRCQKRKIKCSRTHPCINCSVAEVPCEVRDAVSRKYPISRPYVESLEGRVAALEAFLSQLKSTPSGERDAMIEGIAFLDHHDSANAKPEDSGSSRGDGTAKEKSVALLRDGDEGPLSYHGPTSIYSGTLAPTEGDTRADGALPTPLVHSLDAGEKHMSECIALFFQWQYPQFMFINREAFILDFQRREFDGQFCSSSLINAVCAIGAQMSTDSETRASAASYADAASSLLMAHGLENPHTTSVQALLCCAFYEIGAGNLSKGWLYSGMSFRMGQDLGFQRDPETWSRKESEDRPIETEYRRRIYWGCYISDKFLSLFWGRPSTMHESDADVKACQPQPQHIIFNTWLDRRGLEHLKTPTPVIPRITPVFNKQIEIGYIIQEGLSILYSPSSDINSQWAAIALNEVEVKLSRFVENLPTEMRLKEWTSLSEPVQPHLASLHMFFHSTRLCMNRPFLRASAEQAELDVGTRSALMILPATVCDQSVERVVAILKRYRAQHGLRHAPLIFVHGAIVAFNTIVSLARCDHDITRAMTNPSLPALELALKEMSTTWAIAGIMLGRLKGLLSHPHRNTPHEMQFIEEPMISGEALAEWQDMNFGAWLDLDAMLGSVNNEILWNLDELI